MMKAAGLIPKNVCRIGENGYNRKNRYNNSAAK